MALQYKGNMNGERYWGNRHKAEVHNLDNKDTSRNGCLITEIIAAGQDRPFTSIHEAHANYDDGAKCLTRVEPDNRRRRRNDREARPRCDIAGCHDPRTCPHAAADAPRARGGKPTGRRDPHR